MIKIDNIQYRNMAEQIQKNKEDISHLLEVNNLLVGAGVRMVGEVQSEDILPNPNTYDGRYGDAYAVGEKTPYNLYVFTRPVEGEASPDWFNIGPFPAPSNVPGPKGEKGDRGLKGERGSKWTAAENANPTTTDDTIGGDMFLRGDNGNVYIYSANSNSWNIVGSIKGPTGLTGAKGDKGDRGEQGPQGPQGNQGEAGKAFSIAGILTSTDQLPQPTEEYRSLGYIINEEVYVIVGTSPSDYSWANVGHFNSIPGPQGPQGPQGNVGPAGSRGPQGIPAPSSLVMSSKDRETMSNGTYRAFVDYVHGVLPDGKEWDNFDLAGSYQIGTYIWTTDGAISMVVGGGYKVFDDDGNHIGWWYQVGISEYDAPRKAGSGGGSAFTTSYILSYASLSDGGDFDIDGTGNYIRIFDSVVEASASDFVALIYGQVEVNIPGQSSLTFFSNSILGYNSGGQTYQFRFEGMTGEHRNVSEYYLIWHGRHIYLYARGDEITGMRAYIPYMTVTFAVLSPNFSND